MKRASVVRRRLMQRREELEYRKRRHPHAGPTSRVSEKSKASIVEFLFGLLGLSMRPKRLV